MNDIKYDRKGRMLYNPEFHPNHRKPFTKDDLIYLCKFYEFAGTREMSFALGKTEKTVANKVADLRNSGDTSIIDRLPTSSGNGLPNRNREGEGCRMKEPFVYQYTRPSLDWFEYVNVEIKPDDYYYFRLERRFGPSWWLIGMNPKEEPRYHWEDTQIGEISHYDLKRFMKWAKTDKGSKLIAIKTICGSFDIFEEIAELLKGYVPTEST